MGPAFYRINVHIVKSCRIDAILYNGIVCISRMGSTVSHDENRRMIVRFRQLRFQSFDEFSHVVTLIFLTHPVHNRRTYSHLLEVIFIQVVNSRIICIFHTGNNIERCNGYACITFFFELVQCFFGSRNRLSFFFGNTIHNNMRCKRQDRLYIGMGSLNIGNRLFNRLDTTVFVRRAEAEHENSILVFFFSQFRCFMLSHTDFGGLLQSGRRILYFRIQRISGLCGKARKSS